MQELPSQWVSIFEQRLAHENVPQPDHPAYHRWVKFYLAFCRKFGYPATAPIAPGPFLAKLAEKSYSIQDRHHAANAVRLLLRYDPQERDFYIQLSAPAGSPRPGSTIPPPERSPWPQSCQPRDPAAPLAASWEQEYRELETEIKLRNYSPKTFEVYGFWISLSGLRPQPAHHPQLHLSS